MRTIRQQINEMRLRNKLIISYFVASVVPIIVISFTIYQLSAESIEDASQEFVSLYISQATTNLENFIERHNQSTQSILLERDIINILNGNRAISMDEIIENKLIIQSYFGRTMTRYPEIETIILVDVNGDLYHYTNEADKIDPEVLEQQFWYENIQISEHSMFVTEVHDKSYYSKNKTSAAFTIGRILWNYDGSYAGMILFDMNPSHLIQLSKDFLSISNRYDIQLVITDSNNGFIYHSDAATGKRAWNEFIGDVYDSSVDQKSNTIVFSKETNQGKFMLTMEIPKTKLLARINNVKEVTIWIIVACMLFIVTISLLFSYKITRPIQELRRSMKQVELGQYSSLIQTPTANDEISSLVKSYNNMIQKIKELIEDVFIAGMKRKQAQFSALQAQINPHMLYNTLESIRMKAVVKEQDDIAEMIKILAKMFKHSLRKQGEHNFIRHEVEYAANYIFLQNIRYDNRFTLNVRLSERVLNTSIIPLVFQPIVENSIKHGFKDYNTKLHIRIEEVLIEPKEVLIRIVNNGTILPKEKLQEINYLLRKTTYSVQHTDTVNQESESGIGLQNIAERLKLQYGERYYLKISSDCNNGTVVEMLVPLNSKQARRATMYSVVLVDDEKGIIEGLKIIIHRYLPLCKVIGCAYDGMEGLQIIRNLQPDIVISDIRMLHSDGLEMIETLVQEGTRAKFIILSGYAEFEYAKKGMKLGIKFYLNKPIEEDELQDCICNIIQEIEKERDKETLSLSENLTDLTVPVFDDDSLKLQRRDLIPEIKQYIVENYDKNISLSELSNRFFINLHYLSQLFKEKTGQTYLEYLTQVRIERSKELLRKSDLKVYEVCQLVGYSDTTHFSKVFEKTVGCKPSEYRKLNRS